MIGGHGDYYIETGDPCCDPTLMWEDWVSFAEKIIVADRAARFHVPERPDGYPVNIGMLYPGFKFGGRLLLTQYGDEFRMSVPKEHGVETQGQLTDSIVIPKSLFYELVASAQPEAWAA